MDENTLFEQFEAAAEAAEQIFPGQTPETPAEIVLTYSPAEPEPPPLLPEAAAWRSISWRTSSS